MLDDFDNYDDDDDDDDDDDYLDLDDEDEDEDDEDAYDTLEYLHTNQIMTKEDILGDIRAYLRRYQPKFKIVRKRDQ